MTLVSRFFILLISLGMLGGATGILGTVVAYFYYAPDLPQVGTLKDLPLQVPLRIYSRDGRLIAQFGEKRRLPATWEEMPDRLIQAYLASEDDRFFAHPGVDYQGLLRSLYKFVKSGRIRGGGSTITMQLARLSFLTPKQTIERKIREIFLSLKMEREFSKEEILTLYLNKIYLGQRAYGVGAAAQVYYGKRLHELSIAETATLAGLPQAPSRDNPVSSPERAKGRRLYVLRRMLEIGAITQAEHDEAAAEPIETFVHGTDVEVSAPFVAEMVRLKIIEDYGDDAIDQGLEVVTTLDSRLQRSAQASLRQGLFEYDKRHGFRGPIDRVELNDYPSNADLNVKLEAYPASMSLIPAVVIKSDIEKASVLAADSANEQELLLAGVEWARRFLDQETIGDEVVAVSDVLKPGDVVYVVRDADNALSLSQMPNVEGAMVAMDPQDGAAVSLVGGLNYSNSKFNRVMQARRQPGSVFKPFIYSAALELGLTPATIVNDNAVVFQDNALEDVWRPKNYTGRFFGPTRLREALIKSRNLVSIRVLQRIGIVPTIEHLQKFGFNKDMLPRDLSLALGSAAVTPYELVDAYSVFANGGYNVEPYFIERIYNSDGQLEFAAEPKIACALCVEDTRDQPFEYMTENAAKDADAVCQATAYAMPTNAAERVVSAQNVHLMNSMMRDVVRRGTGVRANRLGRDDLAGKTGTTNENRDAWFSGFNASLATVSWIGFDRERPLGRGEAGASAALPQWTYFMKEALADTDSHVTPEPAGMVTVLIAPDSGLLASANRTDAMFETFRIGQVPDVEPEYIERIIDPFVADPDDPDAIPDPVDEELF